MTEQKPLLYKEAISALYPAQFWLAGMDLSIIIPEGGTVVLKVRDSIFTAERVEKNAT